MSKKITVNVNGKQILAEEGIFLSEIINGEKPCGGHGKCGKCKVFAKGCVSEPGEDELRLLTSEELDAGIRLACLTRAVGNCDVEHLGEVYESQIVTDGITADFQCNPSFLRYGVAVDIGTTTIAAKLYAANGKTLSSAACLNPQSEWGADVISRIEASLNGKEELLKKSVCEALNSIFAKLSASADVDVKEIDSVVITGNTVMLSLFTGETVEPFSHAPFEAKRLFGEELTAEVLELLNLSPDTRIYLPPCICAFVGADTVCAVIATELYKNNAAMLADIGTNGEIALFNDGTLTVCATAAGPAFEGVGISMGMRGARGAVDKVSIYGGEVYAHVIGNVEPVGICGSGLVDAVAAMLDNEILDESGYLEDELFTVKGNVFLTQKDIRMLQLAKSAICAGILTVADSKKLDITDVSLLYIAGGFGNYLNQKSAVRIGLLPGELSEKVVTVGNAALEGASMLLLNDSFKETASKLAGSAEFLELSTHKGFADLYMLGMTF